MTTPKNEEFRSRRSSRVEFRARQICEHEENPERNQNAKISPFMRIRVIVLLLDVIIARNRSSTRHGASGRTHERITHQIIICRHESGTYKLATVEFVRDEGFECVEDRVDPANPREPGMHLWAWDHEAGVDDDGEDHDTG